jgi:hypothetical protein
MEIKPIRTKRDYEADLKTPVVDPGALKRAGPDAPYTRASILIKENNMAGNGEMIIELDKKRMTAMAQKDVAALKTMLCKGLIYTHSSGRQDTKDSLIQGMESGTTVYTSVVPSEMKAQDYGNVVVLTGVAALTVNSNGKPNSFRVRFTDVYENQNGTWRMVNWQSTKIPE